MGTSQNKLFEESDTESQRLRDIEQQRNNSYNGGNRKDQARSNLYREQSWRNLENGQGYDRRYNQH